MGKPEKWTLESLRHGFSEFYRINGHYPTAYEVDDFDLLPSARQIQRRFEGLPNLRKILGLPIEDYTRGKSRSIEALKINKVGRDKENEVGSFLKNIFGEMFVHSEKPVSPASSKIRYDFFVFSKPNNFQVDVFSANDERSLINSMIIKENKYREFPRDKNELLFFVYFLELTEGRKHRDIRVFNWIRKKKVPYPSNWKLLNFDEFKDAINNKYEPYRVQ